MSASHEDKTIEQINERIESIPEAGNLSRYEINFKHLKIGEVIGHGGFSQGIVYYVYIYIYYYIL